MVEKFDPPLYGHIVVVGVCVSGNICIDTIAHYLQEEEEEVIHRSDVLNFRLTFFEIITGQRHW